MEKVVRQNSAVPGGGRRHSRASSTSSDILVAPAQIVTRGEPATDPASSQDSIIDEEMRSGPSMLAEVRNGRLLVVNAKDAKAVDALRKVLTKSRKNENPSSARTSIDGQIKLEDDGDEDGRNHRGTYSKAYTILHPEMKWVHRGQGRYLPMDAAKALQSQTPLRESRARGDPAANKTPLQPQSQPRSLRPQRSSLTADEDNTKPRTDSLRRLTGETRLTVDTDPRSARLGRRAQPTTLTDSGRRSSRISTQIDYDEESEDDESDDMAGDKESTFDKEYVDAHPNEQFYHTGNGWYKRGRRPPGRRNAKKRDSEGHATTRKSDGSFVFNPKKTIHVSQLELYPGIEFHHCGNGWYRPGPDSSGLRTSRYGGPPELDDEEEDGVKAEEEDEEEDEDGEEVDVHESVDKAYAMRHPEIEWVHRGKGRYKRKSAVYALNAGASASVSATPERDNQIYTKAYVLAHPNEEFHHRGNARYMRGPPPDHWASVRRKKSAQTVAAAEEVIDDGQLYSKAFVEAHPNIEFHHRGQGRYARGPRKSSAPTIADEEEEEVEEDVSDFDPDVLVDRAYVEAHPKTTFHHRGQGRWARGLPPAGTSRKVAVRGPGAVDWSNGSEARATDEIDDGPPLSALFAKADGPEKFPHLTWNYRGGGKWSRITKAQFEELQRENSTRKYAKPKSRASRGDTAAAQLEREAAAAASIHNIDGGFGTPGEDESPQSGRPKVKRRKLGKRQSYLGQEDGLGTKVSSNSQSKAPTPKPRMLEPEEDILTEEDLPQLYRDDYSPPSEYLADPMERFARGMRPLNPPEMFVNALMKYDPATRPLANLKRLAANAQYALDELQREYLFHDRITAPHARIPRKVAKGGRIPLEPQIFEDRKEADLYDYNFDPRRIGYQDPEAQKIVRDAEGRELRNRRQRAGAINGTLPGWNFGEDEPLGPRRAVKPVNRFDGIVDQPRKRARNSATATGVTSKAPTPSMTPDRAVTPLGGPMRVSLGTGSRGRLMGNVPKRIQELRGHSVGGGDGAREGTPNSIRKGRPPGSKNRAVRSDAGIKKGPRKQKVDDVETGVGSEVDGEGEL